MLTPRAKELEQMTSLVFQPDFVGDEDARYHAVIAIMELACCYAQEYMGQKTSDISFDQPAIHQVIFRFWRDVYGYSRFNSELRKIEEDAAKRDLIAKAVNDLLPIHIWSDQPRKTRIAAGYTYWMAVLRPFRFREEAHVSWDDDRITHFNAHFTAWSSLIFLSRFGSWTFGVDDDDARIRKDNFLQALRYRELSLVTSEALYGSIFRPKRVVPSKNGKTH